MKKEIRSLTGIRGIAACYVVLYHYFFNTVQIFHVAPVTHFIRHGYLAVDLFFCLSGYIMAETYSHSFRTQPFSAAYRLFLGRRFARIYPLYAAMTLVAFYLMIFKFMPRSSFNLDTLGINLSMIQVWGLRQSLDGPAWSISAEAAAYLLFPLLISVTLFKSRRVALVSGVTAFFALTAIAFVPTKFIGISRSGPLDIYSGITAAPVLRCLTEFTMGLIGWRLSRSEIFKKIGGIRLSCDALTVLILILLSIPGSDLAVVILCPLLIALLGREDSYIAAMLGSRIPYGLGVLSYSIYLAQRPVRDALGIRLSHWISDIGVPHAWTIHFLVLLVILGVIATLSYGVIERPGRRLVRALVEGDRPSPHASLAE